MKRTDLVDGLEAVAPALATNTILPLLTMFWFTGRQLMAFNDQVAIAVPYRSDFTGAVPNKLLTLLKASGFEDVDVAERDGNLVVEARGKTSIKLAMMPPEFVFTMPRPNRDAQAVAQMKDLVRAVEHCLVSVGTDTVVVDVLGITLLHRKGFLHLYATDSDTLSCARVKANKNVSVDRAILPSLFCKQMVAMAKRARDKKEETSFEIAQRSDGARERYAMFTAGDQVLYARILASSSPLNFDAVLEYNLSEQIYLYNIPERLSSVIDRACLICDAQRISTEITAKDGVMKFVSKTESEDVRDSVPVPRQQVSDTVVVQVQPSLIKRGLGLDRMAVTERSVVMARGTGPLESQDLYFIACR